MSLTNQHGDEQVPETSQSRVRAVLLTIQILFGVNYLASKVIVTDSSPAAWAVLRTSGAFAVLAVFALAGRRRMPRGRDLLLLAVCALFGVVFNQGFFLEGLSRTTVYEVARGEHSRVPWRALRAIAKALSRSVSGRRFDLVLSGLCREAEERMDAASFCRGLEGVAREQGWDEGHLQSALSALEDKLGVLDLD